MALSSRPSWIRVLQGVCHRYGIFPPTFPMKTMSTSNIKDAALRPRRWGELIPYKHRRWPYYRLPWGSGCSSKLRTAHIGEYASLIPGGRFLVMTSRSGGLVLPTVSLWDLGARGVNSDCTAPMMVASYPMHHNGSPVQVNVCAASGSHLSILVVMSVGGLEYL